MSRKTGELAATTGEAMDLLREQAAATRDLANTEARQIDELREARFAEFLPMLRWRRSGGGVTRGPSDAAGYALSRGGPCVPLCGASALRYASV